MGPHADGLLSENGATYDRAIFVDLFWEHLRRKFLLTFFGGTSENYFCRPFVEPEYPENGFSIQGADRHRRVPSAPEGGGLVPMSPPKYATALEQF